MTKDRLIRRRTKPKGGELRVPAFDFNPEFASAVESGTKLQTIRRTKRAKPGDRLQLYTGLRTRDCRKLGEGVCTLVDHVGIRPDGITFGNVDKHPRDIDEFARADGFTDFDAMVAWFANKYGSPYFQGFVHGWSKT